MTDIEKIREYLVGMANAACCNKQTAKDIKEIIIPHIDSLQEEPASEDLEKEVKKTKAMVKHLGLSSDDIVDFCVHHYTQWQKEQMMKEAIDGVVHHFEKCGVASVHYTDPTGVPMAYFTSPEGLSAGDKVKIIVIKEG